MIKTGIADTQSKSRGLRTLQEILDTAYKYVNLHVHRLHNDGESLTTVALVNSALPMAAGSHVIAWKMTKAISVLVM